MVYEWLSGINPVIAANVYKRLVLQEDSACFGRNPSGLTLEAWFFYCMQVRMVHEWLGGLNPIIAVNVFKRLYCRRLMHAVEEIWFL